MNNRISHSGSNVWSKRALLFIVFGLSIFSAIRHQLFSNDCHVIQWDGYGYYAYLPGVLLEDHPGDYSFLKDHFEKYSISSDNYQVRELDNGKYYPIYNIGLAILWLPFFLIAHLFSLITSYPSDGMSAPYQWAVVIASIFYLTLGWIYLRRFLLLLGGDRNVAIVLLALAVGTNYFYYSTIQIELTHLYLFSLYAVFLYHFKQFISTRRAHYFIIAALCSGLLVLVRSSELFVLFFPLLWGITRKNIWDRLRSGMAFLSVMILIFGIQILYYYLTTGYWFIDGYSDHSFDFLNPHIREAWFGYRRGWLIYTPLMIFALIGFYFLYNWKRPWFLPILVFTVLTHYLLFSWDVWWYGNTFGSRPVVQSYAIMSIPLLALLENSGRWHRIILPILGLFIGLNLFQTWQFEQRIIPQDLVNKTYYWDAFLRTKQDKTRYVYLDTNQKLNREVEGKKIVFDKKETLKITGVGSRGYKEFTDIKNVSDFSSFDESGWIEVYAKWEYFGSGFDKWSAPKLVTELRNEKDEIIFWKAVRLPFVMNDKQKDSIKYNLRLGPKDNFKLLKSYVWNQSPDSLIIHQVKIEALNF